jgi:hypothetical protein
MEQTIQESLTALRKAKEILNADRSKILDYNKPIIDSITWINKLNEENAKSDSPITAGSYSYLMTKYGIEYATIQTIVKNNDIFNSESIEEKVRNILGIIILISTLSAETSDVKELKILQQDLMLAKLLFTSLNGVCIKLGITV